MTTPLVSILIPCYNAAPYLDATLQSALGQTYPNIEIIVVDDGSTDGSLAILTGYDDHGVRVASQSNAGAAAARNKAFALSHGAFVLFLDADDIISADHIAALYERLVDAPGCIALGQWDRFHTNPGEAKFPHRHTYCDASGPEWLLLDWQSGASMTQPGMALIPRSMIEQHGGWDERLSLIDDFEFFTRIIVRSSGVRHAPGARLYYRSGIANSLSGTTSRRAAESAALSLRLGTDHLLAADGSAQTRRACANMLQTFEYTFYPRFADLSDALRRRIAELGGASLAPTGPPGFHKLRRWLGWKAARRIQLLAERLGLNGAARARQAVSGQRRKDI